MTKYIVFSFILLSSVSIYGSEKSADAAKNSKKEEEKKAQVLKAAGKAAQAGANNPNATHDTLRKNSQSTIGDDAYLCQDCGRWHSKMWQGQA